MRVNICCCLFTCFILGCNVTAEILPKIKREQGSITLRCPLSVGSNVTWTRERNGRKVVLLTADGNMDLRHINDTRFSSLADKSLFIQRLVPSDSGTYLCNNEPAVLLTVTPGRRKTAKNADQQLSWWTFGIAVTSVISITVIIAVTIFKKRCRFKRQGKEEDNHTYHYIADDVGFKPKNGLQNHQEAATQQSKSFSGMGSSAGSAPGYSLVTFSGPSQQNNSSCCSLEKPKVLGDRDTPYQSIWI